MKWKQAAMVLRVWGILMAAVLVWGCAPSKSIEEKQKYTVAFSPQTLAIFPFENNSVTDPEKFAPLGKGLAAMLITDLGNAETSLTLVERQKIEALLQEIALGQSGSVDQATAVQVGKILGAQTIAFGAFMVLGDNVRLDVRIVNVETGALLVAESVTGKSDNFMDLESRLAGKIANSLQITFQPQTASGSTIDAALYFSQGVDAMDRGDQAAADRLFEQCVRVDPSYQQRVKGLKGEL